MVVQQRQASDTEARARTLQTALAAVAQPGTQVARLQGSGPAVGATGLAVFPANETGTIVMQGLNPLPSDQTYQAWLIATGAPVSAGLLSVGSDGLAIEPGIAPLAGAQTVALTVENAGGASAPTSDPIVVGQMQQTPLGSAVVLRPAIGFAGGATGVDASYVALGATSLAVVIVPGPWLRARSSAALAAAKSSVPDEPSLADEAIPAERPATPRS